MAKILSGKEVTATLNESLTLRATALRAQGVIPRLAIVHVGERGDDVAYERGAIKRCEVIGVNVQRFLLPETATQERLAFALP